MAERLADVVQQRPQEEAARSLDAAHQVHRGGVLGGLIPAAPGFQQGHHVERVKIDGVDVIEVVLDAARARAELGDDGGHQAGVVSVEQKASLQTGLGIAEQVQPALRCAGVSGELAARLVGERLGHRVAGLPVQGQRAIATDLKGPHDLGWLLPEAAGLAAAYHSTSH